MSRLVRKQIYIEPRQDELLKRQAKEQGLSEAELIRRALDQLSRQAGQAIPRRFPDRQAWEEEKALIEERRRMNVPQTGRAWTREELYDERLGRYSR